MGEASDEWKATFSRKGKPRSLNARTKHKQTLKKLITSGELIRVKHTDATKKVIGEKSSAKFTEKFKARMRRLHEQAGRWIPLEEARPYLLYRNRANWSKKIPVKPGVVRDHIFSRYSGFKLKVFPIILRHPINCQYITLEANLKKAKVGHRYEDSNGMTLEELFEKIIAYTCSWKEQDGCIKAIERFRKGERYDTESLPYQ